MVGAYVMKTLSKASFSAVQVLVAVANIQMRTVKTEVEKGSM